MEDLGKEDFGGQTVTLMKFHATIEEIPLTTSRFFFINVKTHGKKTP